MACLKTSGFQRELRLLRLEFLCHLRCRLIVTYLAHFSDNAVSSFLQESLSIGSEALLLRPPITNRRSCSPQFEI